MCSRTAAIGLGHALAAFLTRASGYSLAVFLQGQEFQDDEEYGDEEAGGDEPFF